MYKHTPNLTPTEMIQTIGFWIYAPLKQTQPKPSFFDLEQMHSRKQKILQFSHMNGKYECMRMRVLCILCK